jgi:hypothetical protein
MRTILEKAHSASSIGTFLLTIVIVVLMVIPMVWHPDAVSQKTNTSPSGSHPMIGWLMPLILAFSLIAAGILHLMAAHINQKQVSTNAHSVTANPLETPKPLLVQNRVPSNATPSELAKIWRNYTEVQAKKLSECYISTWMEISGSVFDVKEPGSNGIRLTIYKVDGMGLVHCTFEEQWEQRCLVLHKDDGIKVLGKISDFNQISLSLEQCEFV